MTGTSNYVMTVKALGGETTVLNFVEIAKATHAYKAMEHA